MRKFIQVLNRYLFGSLLYAMPIWFYVLVHMDFHPWNYMPPSSNAEGDVWLLILALLHTIWSIPGYTLLYWLNSRTKIVMGLPMWLSIFAGVFVICFYLLIGNIFEKLYFFIISPLHLSVAIGQAGGGVIMFFLTPLICIVISGWFSIKFFEVIKWIKPSWF